MGTKTSMLRSDSDAEGLLLKAGEALKAVEGAQGHKYVYLGPKEAQPGTVAHTWTDMRHGVMVMLGIDGQIPARYLVVQSRDDASAERVSQLLAEKLPVLSRDALLSEARDLEKDPGAILRLAMGTADEEDPTDVNGLLVGALGSANARVRANAAMGATFSRSSSLVKPLKTALKTEKEAGVKRLLKAAVEVCSD
ncbi:MAG: hypothetical protein U0441_17520 [Polyangiaceae bacterium]